MIREHAKPSDEAASGETLEMTAYATGEALPPIVPASHERAWMTAIPARSAYRCLPMVIANQSGWFVENRLPFRAIWDGGAGPGHLKILFHQSWGDGGPPVVSWFGNGILTFHLPFVIRTEPGYNLWVRGPANLPKDGLSPLEGIVETDWSVTTFTMNWKITRPGLAVGFDIGEPICMLVPQRRGELARFAPKLSRLDDDQGLAEAHRTWLRSRSQFLREDNRSRTFGRELPGGGWQKHYLRGMTPSGGRAAAHETRVRLRRFVGPRGDPPDGETQC